MEKKDFEGKRVEVRTLLDRLTRAAEKITNDQDRLFMAQFCAMLGILVGQHAEMERARTQATVIGLTLGASMAEVARVMADVGEPIDDILEDGFAEGLAKGMN